MNREEYVQKMKQQIDDWNAKLGDWEVQVQKAQSGAKAQYEVQIKNLQKQRDDAIEHLNKTRDASQSAWMEVSKGAESAWKNMQSGFEKAWGEFHKKP